MRMTDPAGAGKRISSEFSDCGRKPQRLAFLGANAMEDRAMADELVLYTNPMSRGRVARWMLEEVGQPYRAEILEYARSMKAPEYLAINPMGKVPALRHGEIIVTEGAAICAYLADVFPEAGLAPPPGSRLRGPYYRWMFFAAGPIEAANTDKALGVAIRPEQSGMVGYGTREQSLAAVEDQLGRSEYIAGDRFTAADVYVGSHTGWGMVFGTIDKRAAFERYWNLLSARPAAQRAREIDDKLVAEMRKAG
jgi:glutathione S-transferase